MSEYEPIPIKSESPCKESGRYLYVIGPRGGPFKIGISNDVEVRRRLLNTGNHLHLHIHFNFDAGSTEKARELERGLHYEFVKKHIRGEWFALSGNDLETVRNTCHTSRFFEYPAPDECSLDRVTCDPALRDLCQKVRLAFGMSEQDVAKLADLIPQTVKNFENGKGGPDQETVDSIKDALVTMGVTFKEEAGVLTATLEGKRIG